MSARFYRVVFPFPGCDCRPGDLLRVEGDLVQRCRVLNLKPATVERYVGEGHLSEIAASTREPARDTAAPATRPTLAPAGRRTRFTESGHVLTLVEAR
jgi:hypothetical protein